MSQAHCLKSTSIAALKKPLLIIHGTTDPQVPVAMGQALYDAAPEPKQMLIVPDVGHDSNMSAQNYQVVKHFIATVQRTTRNKQ